jgi:hypothetical protein
MKHNTHKAVPAVGSAVVETDSENYRIFPFAGLMTLLRNPCLANSIG